jgi:LmbE family N-acetylglucosaminyl deacetylase
MTPAGGWTEQQITQRNSEIAQVAEGLGVAQVVRLDIPAGEVDLVGRKNLVLSLSRALIDLKPEVVYFPWLGDIHSDHQILGEALLASTKTFRVNFIETLLSYETLSETNFSYGRNITPFVPNWYVDISEHLPRKTELLRVYQDQLGEHPFPRSVDAVTSLALLRGSEVGVVAAEAFHVHRHISK